MHIKVKYFNFILFDGYYFINKYQVILAGIIFEEQNPSDLVEKISSIQKDQQLRKQLINNGLKRGKEFDWSSITQKVYTLYKEIL